MKKLTILVIVTSFILTLFSTEMIIHKIDGTQEAFEISDIQNITFGSTGNNISFELLETYSDGNPWQIDSQGNYLFVCDRSGYLKVYDASNLPQLTLSQNIAIEDGAEDIWIVGDKAYIVSEGYQYGSGFWGSFYIFDISNPSNVILLSETELPSGYSGRGIICDGDYAYIQSPNYDSSYKIHIYNVSNPANPQLSNSFDHQNCTNPIIVEDQYLYIGSSSQNQIKIYSLENPEQPNEISSIYVPNAYVYNFHIVGSSLYLATGYYYLELDITNPSSPLLSQQLSVNQFTEGIYNYGNVTFLSQFYQGSTLLFAVDINTLETIDQLQGTGGSDVLVMNGHIIVAGGSLYIVGF